VGKSYCRHVILTPKFKTLNHSDFKRKKKKRQRNLPIVFNFSTTKGQNNKEEKEGNKVKKKKRNIKTKNQIYTGILNIRWAWI